MNIEKICVTFFTWKKGQIERKRLNDIQKTNQNIRNSPKRLVSSPNRLP